MELRSKLPEMPIDEVGHQSSSGADVGHGVEPILRPSPSNGRGQVVTKLVLLVLVIVFASGGGWYWYFSSGAKAELTDPILYEVKRADFTVKLTELGELMALDSVTISAEIDEPVIFLAPEGTYVREGDIIVRFDDTRYEVALADSEAAYEVAKADQQRAEMDLEAQRQNLLAEIGRYEAEVRLAEIALKDLKKKPLPDELEKARMDFEKAKVTYQHAKKARNVLPDLVKKGFITRNTLDEAELELLEAKTLREVARFNLEKVAAGATPQELEQAQIRLEQARFALDKAKSSMLSQLESAGSAVAREKANVHRAAKLIEKARYKLGRAEKRAPRDGLVVYAQARNDNSSAKVELGMIPFEGQPLIHLPDLSTMVVETEISEFDIGKVKVGGPAEVRPEAYRGVVFHGKVLKIGSLAKLRQTVKGESSGLKVFDVTVEIEEKDPRLKPGLTASLDIIVEQLEDVISVPLSVITTRGEEHFVTVVKARNTEERRVILGLDNEHSIVVKKGLSSGEKVLLGFSEAEGA